jgi:hypothetical protein
VAMDVTSRCSTLSLSSLMIIDWSFPLMSCNHHYLSRY